jgi:UDP-N-acetylglucosamine/UDP-N-acetylgalactosamine diphosphorylase
MTSPATDTETREYFASRSNFGLSSSELYFFQQGTMPSVEQRTGRVILSAPGEVSLSPDGHGGMLAALDRVGLITMARQRGIKYLFYFQVDNPLVAVADPEFLGYHALARSELTSQVVAKKDPLEKVGSVVSVDGQLRVIEYSDLPDDLAALTDAEGRPVFWAGSIAVHVFDVDFLQRAAGVEDWLPFHTAHKKVPSIDEEGNTVTPGEPNAVKFERFIFDLLPHAERAIVVEVDERQAFAPVKNASGAPKDTPETARQAMLAQHGRWLAECGARVGTGVKVEISPKFALDAEELRGKLPPETLLEEDTFLS